MEELVRMLIEKPQSVAVEGFDNEKALLDQPISFECSTLTNHCLCARNLEYFLNTKGVLQYISTGKCWHRRVHKNIQPGVHSPIQASTKLILITAALGKFEVLKYLQKNGCSMETKSGLYELRPLHLSIIHGHFNVFCYLLTQQVDINAEIQCHGTAYSPLMLAVMYGQADMVRYLLMTKNLDLSYRNTVEQTPLMFAVQNNSVEMISLLLAAEKSVFSSETGMGDADCEPEDADERRIQALQHPGALLEALKQDNDSAMKILLDNGCSPNFSFHGYHITATVLLIAVLRNAAKCLQLLLQYGANTSVQVCGMTMIDWAYLLGFSDSISVLEDLGCINRTCLLVGRHGRVFRNSSIINVYNNSENTIEEGKKLVEYNCVKSCENQCNFAGAGCMSDSAIKMKEKENVLSEHIINVTNSKAVDSDGRQNAHLLWRRESSLEPSATSPDTKCDKMGEIPDSEEEKIIFDLQETCMSPMVAIWSFSQWINVDEVIRHLIHNGHDVNARDCFGRTPLHFAVEEQNIPALRTLLQFGADHGARDICNATPFWHAVYWNAESVIRELVFANVATECSAHENAYKIGLCDYEFDEMNRVSSAKLRSPLYCSVKRKYLQTTKLLLFAGYDTKSEDIEELLSVGSEDVRELLLQHIQNPRHLSDLCRNHLRKCLGFKIHELVDQVDLPCRVKDILLCRDLFNIKIEPKF
ncbi:hypothetical protein ACJMK2_005773 [Sinanodonta woodiana]|uniref:SOCS box domain-containing protein n=1 Tax=Sinanodonta woodiana TaxID=1069815 RepID=A0ABD3VUB6_SINWO